MPLIAEYALIPDIFDTTAYTSYDLCSAHLLGIRDALLDEGLIRNLRSGEWLNLFKSGSPRPLNWHGKELLKTLKNQSRIIDCPPALAGSPSSDVDWCSEAIATHARSPVNGIITTQQVSSSFTHNPEVAAIDRLPFTAWWTGRSSSIRLKRSLPDYKQALGLVLNHSNSIMFIDPHLDLTKTKYKDFAVLLGHIASRIVKPRIEIHRVCYEGSLRDRTFPTEIDWKTRFSHELASVLSGTDQKIEIFIWDDFHDRYVISNLIGISVPYGFDTDGTGKITTWTRLGRKDRDDVQREFDLAANRHTIRHRFTVP